MGGGGAGGGGKIAIGGGAGLVVRRLRCCSASTRASSWRTADRPTEQSDRVQPVRPVHPRARTSARPRLPVRGVHQLDPVVLGRRGRGLPDDPGVDLHRSIDTACGNATSAVGPFYCPGDTDGVPGLGFFDELTGKLGAQGGDAAEAYVLAHEFGHHIQNSTGTMRKVQGQVSGPGRSRPAFGWSCRPTATPASGSTTRPRTRTARSPT